MNLQENIPLAPYTTLGVGGPARWFAQATAESEIAEAADFAAQNALPLFVLGGGSNLLVSDAGFPGLVLHVDLTGVHAIVEDGHALLHANAGEDWDAVVRLAVDQNLAGIECLAGIPGNVGGTPVQNVGAYGQEVADTIHRVRAFDLQLHQWVDLTPHDCGFAYRRSIFNSTARDRYVVTSVTYRLHPNGAPALRYADVQRYFESRIDSGDIPTLPEVYHAVREIRSRKGMLVGQGGPNGQSAGSFFKNPVVQPEALDHIAQTLAIDSAQIPHWPAADGAIKLPGAWLIERAGFPKGFALGRAGISTLHTLALVNRGNATAAEIIALRDTVLRTVEDRFNIHLEQEPVFLGF